MWRVSRQRTPERYRILEEFVSMATEAVPDLLSIKERTVLMLSLRTKVYLSDPDPSHLDRRKASAVTDWDWSRSMSSLKEAVSKGLRPQDLQEVFGHEFDSALQSLLCHFLSRLQQLFPVPDFTQVTAMLDDDWTEKCLQETKSEELREMLTNHGAAPTAVQSGLESRSKEVLKSAWQQLRLLTNKTTNQEPDLFKRTNQEPDLFKRTNQEPAGLTPPSTLTIGKPDLAKITNQNPGLFKATSQLQEAILKLTNDRLTSLKSTNHKAAVSRSVITVYKPANQGSASSQPIITLSKPANRKVVLLRTINSRPAVSYPIVTLSKPTNQEPSLSKRTNQKVVIFKPANQELSQQKLVSIRTNQGPEKLKTTKMVILLPTNQNLTPLKPTNQKQDVSSINQEPALPKPTNPEPALPKRSNQESALPKPTNQEPPYEMEVEIGQEPLEGSPLDQSQPTTTAFDQSETDLAVAAINQSESSAAETNQSAAAPPPNAGSQNPRRLAHRCPTCGRCFFYRNQVIKHLSSGRGCGPSLQPISSLQCFQCGQVFESTPELLSHQTTHRASYPRFGKKSDTTPRPQDETVKSPRGKPKSKTKSQSFPCMLCPEVFSFQRHLLTHLEGHALKGEEPRYDCLYCDQTFKISTLLRIHQRSHKDRRFTCPVCCKGYSTEGNLNAHKRCHGEKAFLCHTCGRGFSTEAGLKTHSMVHTEERPHQCSFCNKAFKYLCGLRAHQRRHLGEKPYTCNVCDKAFVSSGDLYYHMRIHTGEKPNVCLTCGKRFTMSSQLYKHRLLHTGEKPFPCPECGKCFRRRTCLQRHLRVHYNDRPFTCHLCPKAYTAKKYLQRHILTRHQDQDQD